VGQGFAAVQRVLLIFGALVLSFGVFTWTIQEIGTRGIMSQVDQSTYQAVHLTGGQLYFGRVSSQFGAVVVNDAYYFPGPSAGRPPGELVRHGTESYGPRDPIIIPVAQVLLIENLREDSSVVQAIRRSIGTQ
jgi:hypothetical protein